MWSDADFFLSLKGTFSRGQSSCRSRGRSRRSSGRSSGGYRRNRIVRNSRSTWVGARVGLLVHLQLLRKPSASDVVVKAQQPHLSPCLLVVRRHVSCTSWHWCLWEERVRRRSVEDTFISKMGLFFLFVCTSLFFICSPLAMLLPRKRVLLY